MSVDDKQYEQQTYQFLNYYLTYEEYIKFKADLSSKGLLNDEVKTIKTVDLSLDTEET